MGKRKEELMDVAGDGVLLPTADPDESAGPEADPGPHPSKDRMLVAVLSLSRSGSSLLARILHEVLQVDFGEPIEHIPANRSNADGYYENASVLEINETVLAKLGAGVFDPPPLDFHEVPRVGGFEAAMHRIRQVIGFHCGNRRRFGFKDPRLALTFPLWKRAFPGIVPVIIFRDPGAAANSIVEQSGISMERALSLWYEYYHRIFHYTAGMRRYFVSFERLTESPVEVVSRLGQHLDVPQDTSLLRAKLQAIVRPQVIRHAARAEPVEFSPYIDAKTKIVYAYLDQTSREFGQPDVAYLGAVMTGLLRFDQDAERKVKAQVERLEADLNRSQQTAALQEQSLAESRKELETTQAEFDRARQVLDDTTSMLPWLRAMRELPRVMLESRSLVEALALRLEAKGVIGPAQQALEATPIEQGALLDETSSPLEAPCPSTPIENEELQGELARYRAAMEASAAEHARQMRTLVESGNLERERLREEAQHQQAQVAANFAEMIRAKEGELARTLTDVDGLRGALSVADQTRQSVEAALGEARLVAVRIAERLDHAEEGRLHRLRRTFLGIHDFWEDVAPNFAALKEDAQAIGARARGFVLQLGPDLRHVPFVEYPLRLRKARLAGLALAPVVEVPGCGGQIGIEIVDPDHRIAAHSQAPLDDVSPLLPLHLALPPFDVDDRRGWRLRVFVRDSPSPVRVFECQKRQWLPPRTKRSPFCRRIFQA